MDSELISSRQYSINFDWSQDLNRLVIQSTGQIYFLNYSEIITITIKPSGIRAIVSSEKFSFTISFDSSELIQFLRLLSRSGFIKINDDTIVNLTYCHSIVEKGNMYVLNLNNFMVISNVNIELIEARLKMQGIRHVYHTKRADTKIGSLEKQKSNPFLIEKELFSQKVLASFL
ncbi:MAG: hypothetical protein CFE21_09870 [Bacteroidetes bacterium B1(2017)]|nr:MAG: hypothetical protein CFE21_09870 [Bacteroidetes bacterium B1(2017)]